ncbi:serine/threonine-protein phosphatase [bacterium]|nr:serine/threonine-protein phosphatase [bacterium]
MTKFITKIKGGEFELVSLIAKFLIIMGIPYIFLFVFFDLPRSALTMSSLYVTALTTLLLEKFNQAKYSKIVLIAGLSFTLFCYSVMLGKDTGAPLIFIPIISLPLVFFESHEKAEIFISASFPVIGRFLFDFFDIFYPDVLAGYREYIGPFSQLIIYEFAVATAFLFTFLFVYFFYQNETELKKANQELGDRSKRDEEYKLARKFQERYLPKLHKFSGIMPMVFHSPSHYMVSGDFYDIRVSSIKDIGYFLADVAGKGIEASYVAIQLHQILRKQIKGNISPREIMQIMNSEVEEIKTLKRMCVAVYISFNTKEKTIKYCRAGLDFLSIFRKGIFIDLDEISPPIGFSETNDFIQGSFQYQPGDLLIASTDGIFDAKNRSGERYGYERFRKEVVAYNSNRKNWDLEEQLSRSLNKFLDGNPLADDVTIIAFDLY